MSLMSIDFASDSNMSEAVSVTIIIDTSTCLE